MEIEWEPVRRQFHRLLSELLPRRPRRFLIRRPSEFERVAEKWINSFGRDGDWNAAPQRLHQDISLSRERIVHYRCLRCKN